MDRYHLELLDGSFVCMGFVWPGFGSEGIERLQRWLLLEAARSFCHVWLSQCQTAQAGPAAGQGQAHQCPVRNLCWSRLLAGPVTLCREKSTLEQLWWQNLSPPWGTQTVPKDCPQWKGPPMGQLMENCTPCKGLRLEKLMKECFHERDPVLQQGKESSE